MRIVVDAYAWIEIFRGSDEGLHAADVMAEAIEVYTPGTVLTEVARKYLREGATSGETMDRLNRMAAASRIVGIDEKAALASAECYSELEENARSSGLGSPSLFDAIVLATARSKGGRVLTGDEHFAGLPETIWLKSSTRNGV